MWPKVATSGFVTELVGLKSRHSLYLDETGVGIDFLSNMSSHNGEARDGKLHENTQTKKLQHVFLKVP